MADNDLNLLAGLEGFLSGASSVAVPVLSRRATLRDQYELELERQRREEEQSIRKEGRAFESKKSLMPFELESDIEKERRKSDITLGREKELASFKAGLKPQKTKTAFFTSELLKMSPEERAALPENFKEISDKESTNLQNRKLDLQKQLDVLKASKADYENLTKGVIGKGKQLYGFATGENPPERDWEDTRGALALSLWSAYTGEKGKFSETDQKLAFGLIPGVYEKGGKRKFDRAIRLAEKGIEAIEQGKEPPLIFQAISDRDESSSPPGVDDPASVKAEDLQIGKSFGGGKIKAVRWK